MAFKWQAVPFDGGRHSGVLHLQEFFAVHVFSARIYFFGEEKRKPLAHRTAGQKVVFHS